MALSLYRSPRDPPFDASEVDLMRRLLVHLSRVLGVMFHLQDQSRQIASSRAALDRGDLVQRTPHPARATGSASTYRLASANKSPRQQAAFGKARAAALAAYRKEEGFEHFAEAVILADPEGKPAMTMSAAPLGHAPSFAVGDTAVRAIVFLHPLQGASSIKPVSLCQIFGMTPTEARAAMQLLESGTAQDMAKRLGISINTFRTQFKAAYAKTNTTRQASLLRLRLSLDGA